MLKALINIALARGMIGRPNIGVVPIRGHSGVQGAAEVGSVPGDYFMGLPVGESEAAQACRTLEYKRNSCVERIIGVTHA